MLLARRGFLAVLSSTLGYADEACDPPDGRGAKVCHIGIRTEKVNPVAANSSAQQADQLCWAACIELVLRGYGITKTQEEIVTRVFGEKVNQPANKEDIHRIAGEITVGDARKRIDVDSTLDRLRTIRELRGGRPVIVGYRLPGHPVGHAVVLTAAKVLIVPGRPNPTIQAFTVRDPMSPNEPRVLSESEYRSINGAVLITVDPA